MGLKAGFPLYPSGINYNVSLSFPGPSSIITKGKDTALMLPNSDYLSEFISGNIGISDSMKKSMLFKNLNSPIASSNEMVFRSFANTNNIDLGDDISKYKKGNKFNMPKDQIEPPQDLIGLKGFEITMLKSMFETQKPYMEIAELVIGNLAKIEDIIARVMPLLGVPLSTKSKKPKINPDAIGYQSGAKLKKELSSLKSLRKKNGETKFDENGNISRGTVTEQTSDNSDNNGEVSNEGNWEVISTVYSTGLFDPSVAYTYRYINLPGDDDLKNEFSDLNLDESGDPYQKYKPKVIIFGIYDSKGNPLNPLSKVKAYDNTGEKVNTTFNKAEWILNSPKWVLPSGIYQWPNFGGAITRKNSNGDTIYYTEGQTNILNGEKAIPGTPIITGFQASEENEYRNFFNDLINIKMLDNDSITQQQRNQISSDISSRLDVRSHLENVFNWGQGNSSIYKRIGIPTDYLISNGMTSQDDPFPGAQRIGATNPMKRSLKPYRIYSNEAAADEKLIAYARSKGKNDSEAGWIWIDPESDYVTKVIRVDPTTRISYKYGQTEPEVQSEIKSFVKNVAIFQISDGREFNVEVLRNIDGSGGEFTPFTIEEGITAFNLENWNYIDNDGIISQFGVVNKEPIINNSNSFKITMWGDIPTQYFNTGENYYAANQVSGTNLFVDEVKKIDDRWQVTKSQFDIASTTINVNSLPNEIIADIYKNYQINPNYTYQYNDGTQSVLVNASSLFSNKQDLTEDGKQRLADDSLVEIENGIITKWYYMTPKDITDDYDNGLWTNLPPNGTQRTITIDVDTIGNNNQSPVDSSEDIDIPQFQIRVRDDDSKGNIIDPSKILNDQLTTPDPFSEDKYGHGSVNNPQNIDVIKRYMLTELDTESYYIVEGILPELVDNEGRPKGNSNSGSGNSSGGGGGDYYKLPDAIGAIKVFISILGDIFGKLIPSISKLIALFKNPASFVTSIISEQMKDGFGFLSDDSLRSFTEAKSIKKNIPSKDIDKGRERKRSVKSLDKHFKESQLSNIVSVREDGEFNSVLDGMAGIPFSIFGLSIPFGMELNLGKLPGSPLNLAFPSNINLKNFKNLQDFISPKSGNDTKSLFSQLQDSSKSVVSDKQLNDYPFDSRPSQTNNQNKTQIKFQDGSSIFVENNSLNDFIISNETKYNFVYVNENTQAKLNEADELISTGTEENLQKALNILDDVAKRNPNNKEINDKKINLKNLLGKVQAGEQPLLKMMLGMVTLPIKIIGGIIEWIMEFFKKLSNPLKLPGLMVEFLSFQWVMQFFTPKGLLEMAGIKFKPEKIAEWVALSKSPTLAGNEDLADLSEFLNVAFNIKLPTYTKEQFNGILPTLPLRFFTSLFCFIEKTINGIIDFVWSTLGIEAVIPPPHIKLCSDTDLESMKPEDVARVLNNEIPSGANDSKELDENGNPVDDGDFDGFYYEVELPSGEKKRFLDRVELDKFIADNNDINYDFTF